MPKSPEKHHASPLERPAETLPATSPAKAKDKGPAKGGGGKDAVKDKDREQAPDGGAGRTAPETVNGNTRVNVAFPFSKIEVQEPSAELVELASLLLDLLGALADWVPEETLRDIRSRAEALSARLAV